MKYILLSLLIFLFACSNSDPAKTLENNKNTDSNQEILKDSTHQPSIDNSNLGESAQFCILSNGKNVEEGWAGNDTGDNSCNKCRCMNGNLACTKMACINSNLEKTFANELTPTKTPILIPTPNIEVPLNGLVDLPKPTPSIELSITPDLCSDNQMNLSNLWIETLASTGFTKCVRPFGILIAAQQNVPDIYIKQSAQILAEILDPDMDGIANDLQVVDLLSNYKRSWITMPSQTPVSWGETEEYLQQKLGSYSINLPRWWMIGDKEFDNTLPDKRSKAVMVEEIVHYIHQFGYSTVYPDIFGVEDWSSIVARETKTAACDWWQHPENDCEERPAEYEGDCSGSTCDVVEFYHQVLITMAGMKPGWLGIGFPNNYEVLEKKLSKEMKDILRNPTYNQINKPLKYTYPFIDYSDDPSDPTFIKFHGNTILIADNFGGVDRDYVTFTVPENTNVKHIILNSFKGEDEIAFFALEKNDKYTALDDISKMISYGHFGPGTDFNKIGSDILFYDKNIDQKTRKKIELEPGVYTFRLQQGTSANASYSFTVYLD